MLNQFLSVPMAFHAATFSFLLTVVEGAAQDLIDFAEKPRKTK